MLEEIWFHPEHGWKNSSDRKILSIPPCLSTGRVQATHFSSCHRDDYIHINQKVFSRIWTVLLQLLSMGRSLKEKTEVQGVARPAVFTEVESQCRWAMTNLCHTPIQYSSWMQNREQFQKPPMQSTLRGSVVMMKCCQRLQKYMEGFLDQLAHSQEAQLQDDELQAVMLVEFTSHTSITSASLVWGWDSSLDHWN